MSQRINGVEVIHLKDRFANLTNHHNVLLLLAPQGQEQNEIPASAKARGRGNNDLVANGPFHAFSLFY
jgi:hypothetical protein